MNVYKLNKGISKARLKTLKTDDETEGLSPFLDADGNTVITEEEYNNEGFKKHGLKIGGRFTLIEYKPIETPFPDLTDLFNNI